MYKVSRALGIKGTFQDHDFNDQLIMINHCNT